MEGYLSKQVGLRAAVAVVGLSALYIVGLAIQRLFYSPIAKFPGPKLAAVTGWYELYYDVVHKGKYLFEIEKMHDKYGITAHIAHRNGAHGLHTHVGPIVRINPYELSIRDHEYYDELYVTGSVRPTDRYEGFVSGVVDFAGSHLATTGHELHRKRRKPLDPYFSRSGVTKLEPMVAELCEKMIIGRFESSKGTGKPVRLDHAFTAFSGDVISRLCIDDPPSFVDDPDFSPELFELYHNGHIRAVKHEKAALGSKDTTTTGGRLTLFRHLVNSDLPASELSDERLSREAQVLIGSGTITTAGTLGFICYYILANPSIRKRLAEELKPVMEGYPEKKPTWAQLEKVEYLQALIKEGLRRSYGTMHRRPRVSPNQPLRYKQWVIPAGVAVGMSAYFQHRDPRIYPRPLEFLPERWLGDVSPEMKNSYIPFSKGSRHCLGMK
ncbi:MAG: hypothetical protein Q9208_001285 [Pyrenodesmia sp. 3 TL-2023]